MEMADEQGAALQPQTDRADQINSEPTMQLHERYRPKTWDEVVAQENLIGKIEKMRERGLGGRAFWLTGQIGTGKTTIARLIAGEVAGTDNVVNLSGATLTVENLINMSADSQKSLFDSDKRGFIIEDADNIPNRIIARLPHVIDNLPVRFVLVFTTREYDRTRLFIDSLEKNQFLSRCNTLNLSRQGLAEPFAKHAKQIAEREGLSKRPLEDFLRITRDHRNDLRAILNSIETGKMLD